MMKVIGGEARLQAIFRDRMIEVATNVAKEFEKHVGEQSMIAHGIVSNDTENNPQNREIVRLVFMNIITARMPLYHVDVKCDRENNGVLHLERNEIVINIELMKI